MNQTYRRMNKTVFCAGACGEERPPPTPPDPTPTRPESLTLDALSSPYQSPTLNVKLLKSTVSRCHRHGRQQWKTGGVRVCVSEMDGGRKVKGRENI